MASFTSMSDELRHTLYAQLDILSKIMYMTTAVNVTGSDAMAEAKKISSARNSLLQALVPLTLVRFHYPSLVFAVHGGIQMAPPHMDAITFMGEVLEHYGLRIEGGLASHPWVWRLWHSIGIRRVIEELLLANRAHPILVHVAHVLSYCHIQVCYRPYPPLNQAVFVIFFSYEGLHGCVWAEDMLWDSTEDGSGGWTGDVDLDWVDSDEISDSDSTEA
jgi:hypothetical protein